MSANTILTSVVTGGSNNHTTTAEEVNALATDFVTQGVVGAITLNTGSGGTGSFCVNQNTGSNMAINIKAGQAYITATPSSQNSQVLRARAAADYTAYTINSNASGSTKYDWIYLQVDATKANNPASDASDVASIVTSRSSSNSTDNGTPPTYGLLLAIVTVANAATAITNSNITDKRFNTSIGAQNGSLIVTQSATGQAAVIQAAGVDASVDATIKSKGTSGNINLVPGSSGRVVINGAGAPGTGTTAGGATTTSSSYTTSLSDATTTSVTVTVGASGIVLIAFSSYIFNTGTNTSFVSYAVSGANTTAASDANGVQMKMNSSDATYSRMTIITGLTAGSTTFTLSYRTTAGTATYSNRTISIVPL